MIIPVVSIAAMARDDVGDGRMLPVVILDTTNRPDLIELFKLHDKLPPGDALTTWATLYDYSKDLALLIEFERPLEIKIVINFDLKKYGAAVDLAVGGKAIYLQAGKPGDRLYHSMEAPRIVLEIGATISAVDWETVWQSAIREELRAIGLNRSEAKRRGPEFMTLLRNKIRETSSLPSGIYILPDADHASNAGQK